MSTSELRAKHADSWERATHHPFLDAVRDGSLPEWAFTTWLVQDYLFVGDLLVFQARLLARAARGAQAVLAGGVVGLEQELSWFEEQAGRRRLQLAARRQPTTSAYQEFLRRLDGAPYAASITALWGIEAVYLESWSGAAPGDPTYREFVEHWTVPAFAEYVDGLGRAADEALASTESAALADEAFAEVLVMERAFWNMAWAGGAAR